jgi:competence protein ComEC
VIRATSRGHASLVARFAGSGNPAARPFHVAAGSVAAGLAASTATHSAVLAVAAGLAGLVLLAARSAPVLAAVAFALVLVGAAAGDARLRALDAPIARISDQSVTDVHVHLLSPPRPNPYGASAFVGVASGSLRGAHLLMRIARWSSLRTGVEVGAELAVDGHVRPLRTPGQDGGFAEQLRRQGVAGELLLDRARVTGRHRGGVVGVLDRMRRRAERAVAAGLPTREAALARGMVLGQDEAIDETTRQDWRASGLSHLLAVSGQNVMLLIALAMPVLALVKLGPLGRGAALMALIVLYVPLAGAGPSLQRAGVMGAAGIAAMTLSRPSSRWYALLLAAAVTLALNPRAGADPGWQLSFAAVAGILAVGRPLAATLARAGDEVATNPLARALVRGLAEGVAITVAATLATAPLVAYHFGAVPVAGLLANILALPAVAPAMWLGMVKAGLGLIAVVAPPAETFAEWLGPPAKVPLAYLEQLAERCAEMRGRVTVPLRSPAAVCAAYVVLVAPFAGFAWMRDRLADACPRRDLAERAAAWRRAPRSFRLAVVVLVIGVAGLAATAGLGSPAPPGELTVRFLDVGQGDATLIQDGRGANVLFDAGPPEAAVYRELRAAGVRRLDLAVSTHQSRDHQGGFHELIERMPIGLLVENSYGTRDPDYRRLLAEADARGIRRVRAEAGEVMRVGRMTIRILGPAPRSPDAPAPDDPNPIGIAAVVSQGAFDLWLSADAESDAILDYPLPVVDAMKVSHHGSADPGLPEVLERLRPKIAAIEVGAHNTYGHPKPSTLATLGRAGIRTYRTDRDGTVTLTVAHGGMSVETED